MKLRLSALIIMFFFALNTSIAQTTYKYMAISWASWNSNKLNISINGTEFSEEKIELPKGENSIFNINPLFLKLTEYQSSGWEVMSINSYPVGTSMCHIAYLRKK